MQMSQQGMQEELMESSTQQQQHAAVEMAAQAQQLAGTSWWDTGVIV